MKITPNTPAKDLTIGGNIYKAGNARNFKTGDWRSTKPVYISEKCKQCGLCFPVCPDDSIPVNHEQKREDFNYDYCKGCGVCAKVCPFRCNRHAITNEKLRTALLNFIKIFSTYNSIVSKIFICLPSITRF